MAAGRARFKVGQNVEYYSKSYDEWIPAVVGQIWPEGPLRLLHDDGSVLKEKADISLVRPAGGLKEEDAKPKASPPRAPTPDRGPAAKPKAKAGAAAGGGTPRQRGGVGISRQDSAVGGGPSSRARPSDPPVEDGGLAATLNPRKFYVGDRVKIKDSGREGEVMYIGTPDFASKEVVGMKLDEKRSKSECDGKAPNGERLFRCPAGYGIFLGSDEVEKLEMEDPESFGGFAPPASKLDLEAGKRQGH